MKSHRLAGNLDLHLRQIHESLHGGDSFIKNGTHKQYLNFPLSLEVTHHGPILNVPSLFIEVGSTEPYWPNEEAAQLLAEVIHEGLGLNNQPSIGEWNSSFDDHPVLITLGGGHYAPKANKLALEPNVWLGHMLANHSLPFGTQEDPGTLWKQSIDAALSSNKLCLSGAKLCAMWRRNIQGLATTTHLCLP